MNNETKTKSNEGPTLAQTVRDDFSELTPAERAAIISTADVVAWFRAKRPEGVAIGCDTDYYRFFTARSLVDPAVSIEFADSIRAASARNFSARLSGREHGARKRLDRFVDRVAEADKLAPAPERNEYPLSQVECRP